MRNQLLFACAVALVSFACGGGAGTPGAVTPEAAPGGGDMAALNKSKCGGCHAPFDAGLQTKAQLEPIMKKHKDEKRVAMGDDDWQKLTDWLAKK